jgi:hypothetical protein
MPAVVNKDISRYNIFYPCAFITRFFIGYWILKRGWISILAFFYFKGLLFKQAASVFLYCLIVFSKGWL